MRIRIRRLTVAHEKTQPSLRIEQVGSRRVVHGVAFGRLARLFLIEHLELFRRVGRGCRVSVEPEKSREKGGHIVAQELRRVALGIDGHEEHLHFFRILAQHLHRPGKIGQGGGTHVRTVGIGEKNHHHLAAKIGQ